MEQKLSPRRRLYDRGLRFLVWLCAGLTCALLLFLIGYIFYRGVPGITGSLLTSQTSQSMPLWQLRYFPFLAYP